MTFEAKFVASATIYVQAFQNQSRVTFSYSCEFVYKILSVIIRKSNPALLAISHGAIVLVAKRNLPTF